MLTIDELMNQVEQLPTDEKWTLVKHLLRSLVNAKPAQSATDWHQFLQETYGSLRDTPLERWG